MAKNYKESYDKLSNFNDFILDTDGPNFLWIPEQSMHIVTHKFYDIQHGSFYPQSEHKLF